ncbi:MAG: hypothetical protein ABIA47_00495 [bacterium]
MIHLLYVRPRLKQLDVAIERSDRMFKKLVEEWGEGWDKPSDPD